MDCYYYYYPPWFPRHRHPKFWKQLRHACRMARTARHQCCPGAKTQLETTCCGGVCPNVGISDHLGTPKKQQKPKNTWKTTVFFFNSWLKCRHFNDISYMLPFSQRKTCQNVCLWRENLGYFFGFLSNILRITSRNAKPVFWQRWWFWFQRWKWLRVLSKQILHQMISKNIGSNYHRTSTFLSIIVHQQIQQILEIYLNNASMNGLLMFFASNHWCELKYVESIPLIFFSGERNLSESLTWKGCSIWTKPPPFQFHVTFPGCTLW